MIRFNGSHNTPKLLAVIICFSFFCMMIMAAGAQAKVSQTKSTQTKVSSNADADHPASKLAKKVYILQIVEHPALNATRLGIEDELREAGVSTVYESAQGNPALASQIAQKFVGSKPDVLIGIGTAASQALAAESRSYSIPIVFSSVSDPIKARLVNDLEKPEGSITGVSNYINVARPLAFIKKCLPKLSKLGIIYNPGEVNSAALLEETKEKASDLNIQITPASANTSLEVGTATRKLISEVDALFINNDNTALSAFESITKIALNNKKPVFVSDIDLVKQGALGALGPDQYILGRQTGKMALKILEGEKPGNIAVEFPEKTEIVINQKVVEKLNIIIPENIKQHVTLWINS